MRLTIGNVVAKERRLLSAPTERRIGVYFTVNIHQHTRLVTILQSATGRGLNVVDLFNRIPPYVSAYLTLPYLVLNNSQATKK